MTRNLGGMTVSLIPKKSPATKRALAIPTRGSQKKPKQRYAVNGRNMHLSKRTTADYERRGELGDRTRRGIHEDARILATILGRSVDIYSSDGIMFEQIHAEEVEEEP